MNGTATIKKFTAFASSWSAALKKIATPLWRHLHSACRQIYPDKTLATSLGALLQPMEQIIVAD
jgi:hypothetical protein